MIDLTTARNIAGHTLIAMSGWLSAEQFVDGRDVIERGALDGAIHLVGPGWALVALYALGAVTFAMITPLLEAVLRRLAPSARLAAWVPFVVLVGLAVAAGLLAGEWTGRDTLAVVLLVIAQAISEDRIVPAIRSGVVRSGVIRAARRR